MDMIAWFLGERKVGGCALFFNERFSLNIVVDGDALRWLDCNLIAL